MALSYQSVQKAEDTAAGTTLVVTKPTSLAVGDLMVAHYGFNSTGQVITPPSGFALVISQGYTDASHINKIYYKIADSGDVAASNFTFSSDVNISNRMVALSRWTGAKATNPITISSGAGTNGGVTSVTIPTMTPASANCMLYMCTINGIGPRTTDSYAIDTNNPTFTEIYDEAIGATTVCYSGAYAYRPEITATGNGTITISAGGAKISGVMFFIEPEPTTSTTTETLNMTETINYVTGVVVADSLTATDVITSTKSKNWKTPNKSSSTWNNVNKS